MRKVGIFCVVAILFAAKFHHFTAAQTQAHARLIDRRDEVWDFLDGKS
nr:hypothetical protein [uncultured Campylobacter sp.]